MIVGTNNYIASNRHLNNYNHHLVKQNDAMDKLSTGLRIRTAKDGASSYAISENMQSQIRALTQANENSQKNATLLKTAQGAVSNDIDLLTSLQALAIKSANDTNTDTDRKKIYEEGLQILKQVDDNANKTTYNGKYLLNGMLDGSSASKTRHKSSTNSVTAANAVTATDPKGNASVYNIGNLRVWDSANNVYKDAAGGDALGDLINEETGDYLFQKDDVITLTWQDNGEDKKVEYKITDTTKTVTDLVTALKSGDGANSFAASTNFVAANTAVDTGNLVNSDGVDVNSGSNPGIYLVGKDSTHEITNVALSVTSSAGNTRTSTQEALQVNAVQQTYGDSTKGSNIVYQVTGVTGDDGDKTSWLNLKDSAGNNIYDLSNTKVATDFTINVDGKEITFTGGTSIEDINKKFEEAGINVRMHIANANEELTYDGETVTKGDINSNVAYKADAAGLYFVAAAGENIGSIAISGGNANSSASVSTANLDTASATTVFSKELSLYNDANSSGSASAVSSANKDSLLPQSNPLWFQIGDEANFGINFTLGIATVKNLLGTDAEAFASKLSTRDGALSMIDTIKYATNKLLVEQTRMGSIESRMGYTSDSLETTTTNLQEAYETMRSVDYAKGMIEYSKYSVLSQMAQVMMAMSNQNAASAVNLLKP